MNIAIEAPAAPDIERPLARAEFEAALLAAIAPVRVEDSRFYQLVASGRCPRSVLQRYAKSTYLSAKLFAASLAELIEKAPDRDARLTLLENLMEEEGVHLRADTGLVVRPERRHVALALRFVAACGADVEAPEDGALHATVEGRRLLAEGRWLEAAAYLLVGQELLFGTASQRLFALFRDAGFAERDIAFFAVHNVDCDHGREALDLVLDRARSRAEQQACIVAATASARHWLAMMGGPARRRA
jgi:pyrroloquinoline quinone (PQQ) biosynthesis protein C